MDLVGKYSFANMMKSSLGNSQESNQSLLYEFKIREDAKMRIRLPGYDESRCFGLSNEWSCRPFRKNSPRGGETFKVNT